MLTLYCGNDTIKVRAAALSAVEIEGETKRVERIEARADQIALLSTMGGTTSLFGEQTVYVIDTPSDDETFKAALLSYAPLLPTSANSVIVIEGSLLAPAKKEWEKVGATIKEHKSSGSVERFDTFRIANALADRDKKSLWLLLMQAKQSNIAAEEIIGVLWWQVKTLRLAALCPSAEEAGLKQFPYDKAKRALRNFKEGELETITEQLLTIYHEGHAGLRDIDEGLEAWALRL